MQGGRLSSFGIGGLVSPLQIENCALLGSISMHREASPTNPCILFQASQRCVLFLLPPVSTERKDPFSTSVVLVVANFQVQDFPRTIYRLVGVWGAPPHHFEKAHLHYSLTNF